MAIAGVFNAQGKIIQDQARRLAQIVVPTQLGIDDLNAVLFE